MEKTNIYIMEKVKNLSDIIKKRTEIINIIYEELKKIDNNILINYFNSSRFKIFNNKTYYSSYITDVSIIDKDYIWVSENMGQSITYPFEKLSNDNELNEKLSELKIDINPVMYKFNINDDHNLLISNTIENTDIFLIPGDDDFTLFNIIKKINKNIFDINLLNFKVELNHKILIFIEAFNKIIDDLNDNNIKKIDGYQNLYDQEEIAFCNFKDLNKMDITKYNITLLENKNYNETYNFPKNINSFYDKIQQYVNLNSQRENYKMILYNFSYIKKCIDGKPTLKIYCNKGIIINYTDGNNNYKYECNDNYDEYIKHKMDTNNFIQTNTKIYQDKYMKYKLKYLKLKSTILG